jgi:Flp pilus assembly protein TadG
MKLGLGLQGRTKLLARAAGRVLRRRGEEGATLVEFAITLPILMAMLTGTCSVAMAMYSLQRLANATTTAVQTVANGQGTTIGITVGTSTYSDSDPCEFAAAEVTSALSGWNGAFSYTMVITDDTGATHTYSSTTSHGVTTFSCTAGSTELAQNEPVTLTVTYAYSWLPILAFKPTSINLTSSQGALAN